MTKSNWTVIAALFLTLSAKANIQDDMNAPLVGLSPTQITTVQTKQFIFVDGIFGDHFKSNFGSAIQVLNNDWNVTDEFAITPDTTVPMSDNAEMLYAEITKLRQASPHRTAVLTAHSKGAVETLLMVLRHPDVVSELGIETFNLVSGPIEGTNVVQYLDGCSPLDFICGFLNQKLPSIEGFLPENIIPLELSALDALNDAQRTEIQTHLFYVETQMTNFDLSSPLLPTHYYLNTHGAPANDGLIPTANERFTPRGQLYGTDLGIMHGDHNSLMAHAITPGNKASRKAFFQVLIEDSVFK